LGGGGFGVFATAGDTMTTAVTAIAIAHATVLAAFRDIRMNIACLLKIEDRVDRRSRCGAFVGLRLGVNVYGYWRKWPSFGQ
jgi:hypothetical protein